jgi:MFS family permease
VSAAEAKGGPAQVVALLASVGLLMAGSGPLTTLISLRLEALGTASLAIGAIMAAYFAGLTLGALLAYRIVLRAGHIRAFAAFAAVASAIALAYPLVAHPLPWAALRLIEGFCMAGIFICVESWLNERAAPAQRGKILAMYMICLYLGQAAGQLLLGFDAGPGQPQVFMLVSMLMSVAILPVALTRQAPPALPDIASFSVRRLYRTSPLGMVGTVASGLVLGAVYSLGPVFARGVAGLDAGGAARFMSVLILGGVLLQWPLGRLSDSFDRRRVIVGTMAALVAAAAIVPLLAAGAGWALFGATALFGGFAFALYPLCVGHMNDHLQRQDRVAASGGLVLAYSAGATAGPLAASATMSALGASGLFVFITGIAAVALAFGLWRMLARAPVPSERQGRFQLLPRTTPASAPLDPRTAPAADTSEKAA